MIDHFHLKTFPFRGSCLDANKGHTQTENEHILVWNWMLDLFVWLSMNVSVLTEFEVISMNLFLEFEVFWWHNPIKSIHKGKCTYILYSWWLLVKSIRNYCWMLKCVCFDHWAQELFLQKCKECTIENQILQTYPWFSGNVTH